MTVQDCWRPHNCYRHRKYGLFKLLSHVNDHGQAAIGYIDDHSKLRLRVVRVCDFNEVEIAQPEADGHDVTSLKIALDLVAQDLQEYYGYH